MQGKKRIITYEGAQRYKDELDDLKRRLSQDIALKIKTAREQGDISENAEYDAALEEQGKVAARIEELTSFLNEVEVIVEEEVDTSSINVGCLVKLLDIEFNEELEYKIVGSHEANSINDMISNESPLGKALIGHEVGDIVEVDAPAGIISYKVLHIARSVSKKDE